MRSDLKRMTSLVLLGLVPFLTSVAAGYPILVVIRVFSAQSLICEYHLSRPLTFQSSQQLSTPLLSVNVHFSFQEAWHQSSHIFDVPTPAKYYTNYLIRLDVLSPSY